MFEPINLDCLTIDPVELRMVAGVLGDLANYASYKAEAMKHRRAGDIVTATYFEQTCEGIYQGLPKWAQW